MVVVRWWLWFSRGDAAGVGVWGGGQVVVVEGGGGEVGWWWCMCVGRGEHVLVVMVTAFNLARSREVLVCASPSD